MEKVIPSRSNCKEKREIDKYLYKERHLVENFCSKTKWFRRVTSGFCKTTSSYMPFLCIAGTLIRLGSEWKKLELLSCGSAVIPCNTPR
ncbi:hypothetical protein FACS189449_09900 [Alphaproteobacteria bacterium]|nr:hypothetical protein FACS189449_09900 [Alphaproteobacteria bacterium]